MNIEINHILRLGIFMLIGMSLSMAGCKKEYINLPSSNAEIESFSIPLTGTAKSSLVVDQQNLTLYWSEDYWGNLPDSIAPVILVSANSTIKPASGVKVALKDGMTYTVTAQDGTVAAYTLKLVINQAQPAFIVEVEQNLEIGSPATGINFNSYLANILWDVSKTKLYLIDPAGTEFRMPVSFINNTSVSTSAIPYSGVLQSGTKYKVKIVSGFRSVESSKAIITTTTSTNPLDQIPQFFNLEKPVAIKRGETLTLKGRNLNAHPFSYIRLNFSSQNLEITSISSNEVTVKIPMDYPLGSSSSVQYAAIVTGQNNSLYRSNVSTAGTEISVKE